MTTAEAFNSLIDKLGIFQPSPNQLYDSLSGTNEYGPYGTLIKNNIVHIIRRHLRKENFWEVDFPIISPEKIWDASGHLKKFKNYVAHSDNKTYHLDKLIPSDMDISEQTEESLTKFLIDNPIIPKGNVEPLHDVIAHSLLVSANLGNQPVILRPETATTSYLSFKSYFSLFRGNMPIKVFQYGRAFRNEMTGRRGLIRSREFEQLEAQTFLLDENRNYTGDASETSLEQQVNLLINDSPMNIDLKDALSQGILNYDQFAYSVGIAINIMTSLGIPKEATRLNKPGERFRKETTTEAVKKPETWNLEVKTDKYGWLDIGEVHERFDLEYHQNYSGKKLSIKNSAGADEIPIILEIAFGIGRLMYTVMENSFYQREGKNVFGLEKHVAPVQLAVLPLVNNPVLKDKANKIVKDLKNKDFITLLEHSGSIGKRYARMDELGVPYCITLDNDTATSDTVTIRNRDTTLQERVNIEDITSKVCELYQNRP